MTLARCRNWCCWVRYRNWNIHRGVIAHNAEYIPKIDEPDVLDLSELRDLRGYILRTRSGRSCGTTFRRIIVEDR